MTILIIKMEAYLMEPIMAWTDRGIDNMEILEKSSREPLYDESNGCGKEFTQLCVMLERLKLKASHGWSDNIFSKLLSLLAKLLPKPSTLPTST
jgi:hypothetical protein